MLRKSCYISIILLLCALASMPYGYYTFLKLFIFFTAGAVLLDKDHKSFIFFSWVFIAILYNPFMIIRFPRDTWEIINIITVLFIAFYLWKDKSK